MARADSGNRGFGARRMRTVCEHALEQFVAGDFGPAVLRLAKLAAREPEAIDSAQQVVQWAAACAERGALDVDSFLLALIAARKVFQHSEASDGGVQP
jgi:hypothetical protein